MRKIILLFNLLISQVLCAQGTFKKLSDSYKFDTLLQLHLNVEIDKTDEIIPFFDQNYLYAASFSQNNEKMVFSIEKINLLNFKYDVYEFQISSKLGKHIYTNKLSSIDVKDDTFYVHLRDILLIFHITKRNNLELLNTIKLDEVYAKVSRVKYKSPNKLYFGTYYNYETFGKIKNYAWGIFDITTGKADTIIYPFFNGIEFSHMQKNRWMDFRGTYVLNTQTLRYEFDVINGFHSSKILRNHPDWKEMPENDLADIRRKIRPTRAKDLIDLLVPYHNGGVSRVVGGYFINDTSLMIAYSIPDSTKEDFLKNEYFIDIWIKADSNWVLHLTDLSDNSIQKSPNDFITKDDIPILHWLRPFAVFNRYLCVIKNETPILPYNDTLFNITTKQKQYLLKSDPKPYLILYKQL
jgi:hypothetical protein